MSSIRWRAILGAASLTCLLGVSGVVYAETALKINSDPCVKCHKRNGLMQGHHGQDQLNMSCSTCHGEKGNHPRKPNDLRYLLLRKGLHLQPRMPPVSSVTSRRNWLKKSGPTMFTPTS